MPNVREASRQKAEELVAYLKGKIADGSWQDGDKLPTEKALVNQFSAARNTVRKALAKLEREGMIVRQVGRGTFVRAPAFGVDTGDLPEWPDASPAEINELRIILEPAIAEWVVARATASDLRKARLCLENSLKARDIGEYEHWDAELHSTIIGASRNNMLLRIYGDIHEARQRLEWYELKRRSWSDERRRRYDDDHTKIVEALERRDAVALKEALMRHLTAVNHNMLNPVP